MEGADLKVGPFTMVPLGREYVRPYEALITNESRPKNAAGMTHKDAAI
jgi:hypothetical protein